MRPSKCHLSPHRRRVANTLQSRTRHVSCDIARVFDVVFLFFLTSIIYKLNLEIFLSLFFEKVTTRSFSLIESRGICNVQKSAEELIATYYLYPVYIFFNFLTLENFSKHLSFILLQYRFSRLWKKNAINIVRQ